MDVDTSQRLYSLAEARRRLIAVARVMEPEVVTLAELVGRVLAVPITAAASLPAFANSALDGFALRAADAPGPLPIAFAVAAGDDPPPLPAGSAAAIATGGIVPEGADAVAAIERSIVESSALRVEGAIGRGDGVRAAGADVVAGTAVLPAGRRIDPVAASAVAAVGLDRVACARRPRAVVLTTGDELVSPGQPLRRGQIHDSNTTLIAGLLAGLGCQVAVGGRVPDTLEGTERLFGEALAADLVISSGGVSVGPRDHVKPALMALGVEELFWRVAIQPGKPTWAGRAPSGTVVVGLPGNPLSTLVALRLLVAPLVDAMLGRPPASEAQAVLGAPVRRLATRLRALPATVADGVVTPLAEASHQIVRAAAADVLVLLDPGDGVVAAGTTVPVEWIGRP